MRLLSPYDYTRYAHKLQPIILYKPCRILLKAHSSLLWNCLTDIFPYGTLT